MHAGFKLQDSRVFTLDQSSPVTTITAATIPYQDSKRAAQFAFGATDMLPVSLAPAMVAFCSAHHVSAVRSKAVVCLDCCRCIWCSDLQASFSEVPC